jgi:hypothetical protein
MNAAVSTRRLVIILGASSCHRNIFILRSKGASADTLPFLAF